MKLIQYGALEKNNVLYISAHPSIAENKSIYDWLVRLPHEKYEPHQNNVLHI
jgi:glutamine amidotransferase PdxT